MNWKIQIEGDKKYLEDLSARATEQKKEEGWSLEK
jgi:hypothetical protein